MGQCVPDAGRRGLILVASCELISGSGWPKFFVSIATHLQFGFIQFLVYGIFILGINLNNLLKYPIENLIKVGMFFIIIYFSLSLLTLVYLSQNLFCVMENVLFFFMSTGLIFYSLHRKAIEMPKAPMGTIIAVFSTTMNLFAFLGSLLVRKLHF
jgi:hypothetical protein